MLMQVDSKARDGGELAQRSVVVSALNVTHSQARGASGDRVAEIARRSASKGVGPELRGLRGRNGNDAILE